MLTAIAGNAYMAMAKNFGLELNKFQLTKERLCAAIDEIVSNDK